MIVLLVNDLKANGAGYWGEFMNVKTNKCKGVVLLDEKMEFEHG